MKRSRREFLKMTAMALGGAMLPKTKAVETEQDGEQGNVSDRASIEQASQETMAGSAPGVTGLVYDVEYLAEAMRKWKAAIAAFNSLPAPRGWQPMEQAGQAVMDKYAQGFDGRPVELAHDNIPQEWYDAAGHAGINDDGTIEGIDYPPGHEKWSKAIELLDDFIMKVEMEGETIERDDGMTEVTGMYPTGRVYFVTHDVGNDNNSGLSPDESKRTIQAAIEAIEANGTRCEPMTMVLHLSPCEDDDSPEALEAAGILPECTGTSWEVPSAEDLQEFDESGRWVSRDGGVTFTRHSDSNPGRIAYSGDSGLCWMTPEDERLIAGLAKKYSETCKNENDRKA